MTFLPIVRRELRVASRKRATYWVRSGAGVMVIGLGVWLFVVMQGQKQREIALGLFYVLTGSAVLYALLSGLRNTADCLSEEKREGTLGLLFLTDLKGYDVVLGKLMASSINALYAVLAMVPMLAIPLLMGGLTPGEFARMALLALNALFFSLAAGICVSALSRSAQHAMLGTAFVILLFTGLLPGCGSLFVLMGKTRTVEPLFMWASAGYAYFGALDQVYKATPGAYLVTMAVINVLGWVFLATASAVAPWIWQDRPAGAQNLRWSERWTVWSYGEPADRAVFRRQLLDKNPFLWLASRARIKPALVWLFLACVACIWIWGLAKARSAWLEPGMYIMTGLIVNVVLRCWFAAEATRQLAEDRKAGTLELLLSTPLQVSEILRGQMLALARQFLGPVLVVIAVETLFMAASVARNFADPERKELVLVYCAGMVMFLMDLCALYWVGTWEGLSAKSQSRAISTTLGRIMVLPWAVIAVVLLFIAVGSLRSANPPDPGGRFFLGLWFITGVLVDLAFAAVARYQLLTNFRVAAQERYGARSGFWEWLRSR